MTRRRWIWLVVASAAATIGVTVGLIAVGDAQTDSRCSSHADAAKMTNGAQPYCVNNRPSSTLPR